MNTIYLMLDEKRNFALVKVGFTTDIEKRIVAYTTHNPLIECISMVNTRETSKRDVQQAFHKELAERGYERIKAIADGKKTEWFKIEYNDPFMKEIETKGLNAFKCGKNRKNLGCYVKVKG